INSHMSTYRQLDKPLMILEYSFVVKGRGMRLYNTNNTVMTQQQRGLGYRLFTEQLAANPLVVGFGWFIYYDQPVTMRSLPSGENFNFGLVNQCDQPYDDMITEVKKSNTRLFAIHQGTRKPISEKKTGVLIERQSYAMPTMRELKIPYKQLTSLAGALKDCSGMKSITVKKSNDLSVVYYLAWDEQQLYLVAKVIDDVFSNNETPDRIWNCDGIEVWINENQFGLAALGANCTPQSYCWKGQHQGELGVVQVAFTRRDNLGADADMQHAFGHSVKNAPGWVLAAAIPWSAVLDKAPGNQQHLHLAIGVDDSDTHGEPGDRDAQVYFPKHWSWGAVNTFQDTVLEK
ncbi:MAG TPA: sugar-binding protein, partial [Armatimonadota bacterium]|nr:sugar-binding protein [Armatimonadota bacterium]